MPTYKQCMDVVEHEKRRSLGTDLQRPMTTYESQIVYGLHAIAVWMDMAKGVMGKRNAHIIRANARIGLIKWACRSLYEDYVKQLTPEGYETFTRRASNMQLSVTVRKVSEKYEDGWKFCNDKDIEAIARAAWDSSCMFCGLTGQEAKKCKLRKTLDSLQCIEPSDNPQCWYRGD